MAAQTNPTAPGFKTSEFAATGAGAIGVGLLGLGIVSVDILDPIVRLITTAISGAAAIFTIGWLIVNYVQGRRDLKAQLIEKGIITSPVEETPAPEVTPEAPAEG